MPEKLISADNHIDLTYCPPDLWSAQAPQQWRANAPRVEDRDDGLHWLVDGQDKGMWNGVGPGFLKYQKGSFHHVDEMKDAGFEWDYRRGAKPRPDHAGTSRRRSRQGRRRRRDRLRLPDDQPHDRRPRDARLGGPGLQRLGRRLRAGRPTRTACSRSPSCRTTIRKAAAAEVRRCAKIGLRGGDLAFKHMVVPLWHHDWYALWEAAAECRFPISFHSTGFQATRAPNTPEMEKEYATEYRLVRSALFQTDTMEVLVSLLASGACEKYPDFNFVLGESGVTWLPYIFDRLDTEYHDRARSLDFKLKPSDYFRRQGYVTYQQDKFLEPIVPLIGEDNIMWGSDYPHPDSLWPESHAVLAENLAAVSPTVRRKIVCDNAARLYSLN